MVFVAGPRQVGKTTLARIHLEGRKDFVTPTGIWVPPAWRFLRRLV